MSLSVPVILHASAGLLAFLAALVALVWRKGELVHRRAGQLFVATMAVMAGSGALIALSLQVTLSVIGGVLTLYLVVSGWLTVARTDRRPGLGEGGGLLVALFIGGLALMSGLEAANSASGLKDGFHPGQYFMFGVFALLAAAGDIRLFLLGGLTGLQRIARHLWRMCLALAIAAAAFFLGQARLFPEAVRDSNILFLPVLLALAVMVYWLLRMSISHRFRLRGVVPDPAKARSQ